jgi:hypothetical protein
MTSSVVRAGLRSKVGKGAGKFVVGARIGASRRMTWWIGWLMHTLLFSARLKIRSNLSPKAWILLFLLALRTHR